MRDSRSLLVSLVVACAVGLAAPSHSRADAITDRLNNIVVESFGVDIGDFTAQSRFEEDLGADPIHKAEFILALIVGFNIHISDEAIAHVWFEAGRERARIE